MAAQAREQAERVLLGTLARLQARRAGEPSADEEGGEPAGLFLTLGQESVARAQAKGGPVSLHSRRILIFLARVVEGLIAPFMALSL